MESEPRSLRAVAQQAQERQGMVSGRRLEALAREHGFDVSHTTINRILNGKYDSRASDQTIQGLAFLAGLPADRVYAIAGVAPPLGRFADELPADADRLTSEQREVVLGIVRAFAKVNDYVAATGSLTHTTEVRPNDDLDVVEVTREFQDVRNEFVHRSDVANDEAFVRRATEAMARYAELLQREQEDQGDRQEAIVDRRRAPRGEDGPPNLLDVMGDAGLSIAQEHEPSEVRENS